MDLKLLQALGTALFIGALVGTERTKHQKSEQAGFAGLRTFILFAELGAVLGWLSLRLSSPALFTAGLVCVTIVVAAAYVVEKRNPEDSVGTTTEISAILVYVLGGLSMTGYAPLAVALGIATAALLATKETLHQGVRRINHAELLAALRLLFASFIVLPLLPRHPIDPWGALNPYKLWLLVILISALSMVGYVAVRAMGAARGVLVTGFFGGIVSSTAATLTFARQSRETPDSGFALVAGTLISWTVMFLRVVVLVAVLRWSLLGSILAPVAVLGVVGSGFCFLALRRAHGEFGTAALLPREASFRNPFKLLSAVKFALVFAVVLLAAKLVLKFAPGAGIYWLSAIAGITDVDAIVLSISELAREGSKSNLVLARSILIAVIANTLGKFALAAFLGTPRLARLLAPATAAMVGMALAMLPLIR
ncbi:MAG TPA: MgtC/SapB family protein [Polyangiaceae bacterium]|nr:MgtC/SapB family protein [Polyangiaceae bacterium]